MRSLAKCQSIEDIDQEVGQPMARTSKITGDKVAAPKGKVHPLKTARSGTPKRQGSAIKNQVEKFGDIWEMLIKSKPLSSRGSRRKRPAGEGTGKKPIELDNTGEETESQSDATRPSKRFKGPKDMPDRGPKPHGPPPPPGGTGSFAEPVGQSGAFARVGTTIRSH
jgi:hypothetical protein